MRTAPSPAARAPEELLARFRTTRDPDALGALFDATAPSLLRVALSIAPDAASAENALQETFLAVLEAPERWDETRPAMPWLLGILHRQVGKVRRDGARRPDPFRLPPPLADDPSALASSNEEQTRVRAAIDELPEPYRAVAVLRWRHGLDPADIADVRGEPPGTTRSLLSRALEKLRERLGGGALALFGVPGTRGLAGIRRALMTKAAAATAAGTTAAVVGGAFVMKKIVAACVVLVLVAGGTWWTAERLSAPSEEEATAAGADTRAAAVPAEKKHARAPLPAAAAPADDLPPPVDLDRADRDLDLFGRVVDEDGRPVAGAKVTTIAHPWRSMAAIPTDRYYVAEDGPRTRSARDGTFAIRLTRGAIVDLRADADGFGELVREQCLAGERVTMTLRRGATLDVTTVDEAGAPVPGVAVKLRRAKQFDPLSQAREGVTDAAGHVAFAHLIAGPSTLEFHHATLGEPEWQHPTVPAKGTLTLRVTMPAGRVVTGRVTVAETGAPLAGARVATFGDAKFPAVTGADGRYSFPGWTGHGTSVLRASAPGYGGVWRKVPAEGELDFVLSPGDRAVGRVVHADGTPAADASVVLYGPGSTGRQGDTLAARTGADGRFEVSGVQHDMKHWVVAVAPGFAKTVADVTAASADGTIDVGDVVMQSGRSIEGLATDGDGKPLAEINISMAEAGDDDAPAQTRRYLSSATRRTDDLGRFRFPDLAPGTYQLSIFCADAPKTEPTRVVLPPDRDLADVRVKMAGARSITLFVVDESGAAIDGMDVQGYGNFGQVGRSTHPLFGGTGADGRLTFRGLPAGEATFQVCNSLAEKRYLRQKVGPVVPDGQEVRVVLRRAAEIRGVVRGDDGAVVPRMTINAYLHRDGSEAGVGFGGEDGTFTIHVPADEAVDVRVEGWQSEMKDGQNRSFSTDWRGELTGIRGPADGVVLHVSREKATFDGELYVVVRDSADVPVPGMWVSGPKERLATDADGRVHFEKLPTGKAYVWATLADPFERPRALDVPPRGVEVAADGREVVLKFRQGVPLRGRVVDASGNGVANATVSVETNDSARYAARCDAAGRFATAGVAGLAHRLTAGAIVDGKELSGLVEGVVPGDAEVTITVTPRTSTTR